MPAFQIEIRKEAVRHSVSLPQLKKITSKILRRMGCQKATLSVLLVSDRKIRTYNRKYLKHDRATDVIAFGYSPSSSKKNLSGDLVISLETAKRQAKTYGNSFFYEVCFYLCHGILHIMGYDDKTKAKRERMLKKQAVILKKIGV